MGLVSPDSLVPDLRTSKLEGQANFVNPGLFLYNAGVDIDITPKLRGFVNLNLLRFARTEPLELLLFQSNIHAGIGADSGIGFAYRPPLSENMVITGGMNALVPFQGLRDISTNRTLILGLCECPIQILKDPSNPQPGSWHRCQRRVRVLCALLLGQSQSGQSPQGTARLGESREEADRNSTGCIACHGQTDSASMHTTGTVRLGCADCHGGNVDVLPPAGAQKGSAAYDEAKKKAHPKPSIPGMWQSSANPVRALHRVAERDQGIHQVRQSGRPARGARRRAARPAVMPRKCTRSAPA